MKKPLSLSTLRRDAAMTANAFGHRLRWSEPSGRPAVPHLGQPYENYSQSARCKCGATVRVSQSGQRMTGSAVSGPCSHGMQRMIDDVTSGRVRYAAF